MTNPIAASGTFTYRGSHGPSARLRCHAHHRRGCLGLSRRTATSAWRCCAGRSSSASTSSTPPTPTAPSVSEELIAEALHPYGDVLDRHQGRTVCARGPTRGCACGRPEYLRQQCEISLRRLGQESLDLFQLHRVDPKVPADEQFGLLATLLDEGKVQAVGLSEVTRRADRGGARRSSPISTVQNLYNLTNRQSRTCSSTARPTGSASSRGSRWPRAIWRARWRPRRRWPAETGVSRAQLSLAWLLAALSR